MDFVVTVTFHENHLLSKPDILIPIKKIVNVKNFQNFKLETRP